MLSNIFLSLLLFTLVLSPCLSAPNEQNIHEHIKSLDPSKVIFALDCGAFNTFKSPYGFTYLPDQEYSENTIVANYQDNDETRDVNIKYTNDQKVYLSERHAEFTFFYEIPIEKPGVYVLILKFAEMYFNEPNKRIFNILFGDTRVVQDIDIFAKVGKFAAYDEYIEFELRDDIILYKGQPCSNAYRFMNKRLILGFEKTEHDNPKVDGIVLFSGSLADTDYHSLTEARKVWDVYVAEEMKRIEFERKKQESQKRKEKDADLDSTGYVDEDVGSERSITHVLFSGPGLIIIIVIVVFVLYASNLSSDDESKKRVRATESKPKKG